MDTTVSVACLIYNHEQYIEKAILGILNQKTSFKFEVILCDDSSTDHTSSIINKFLLYRNINCDLKYFKHPYNIGVSKNLLFCLNKCIGKYIAFCDGDDYWTDDYKLQKQVDFLESNPDFSICFHDVEILSPDGFFFKDYLEEKKANPKSTLFDLLYLGNYIQTCSAVIRNNLSNLPFDRTPYLVDYVLWVWCANFGKVYRIQEKMAIYRIGNGIWSSLNDKSKLVHQFKSLLNVRNLNLDIKYLSLIDFRIAFVKFHLLPIELKKVNLNNYDICQYLSHSVHLKDLFKVILMKMKNNYFKFCIIIIFQIYCFLYT